MKTLTLINKYKFWIAIFLMAHVIVFMFYVKIVKHIDNKICENGFLAIHCAESPFFKDNYKSYYKFMMKNFRQDELIKNEVFAKNFTQIMKVCEIKNDCNASVDDWEKYKDNRKLCSQYYMFCRVDYLFAQYNKSTLIVKDGFKEYMKQNIKAQ